MFIRKWMILVMGVLLGSASVAHHSTAMFDASKTLTLEGTVKKFSFTNPHSWIYLTVVDAQGKEIVWELEGGSTSHMARNGWTYKSIKAGDKVTIVINPRVDGEPGGAFRTVTRGDGVVLGQSPAI